MIGCAGATSAMSQQMQQLVLVDETDSYLQERSDAMQNIESTVVELGGIFTQASISWGYSHGRPP
jgi:hypothetical protein